MKKFYKVGLYKSQKYRNVIKIGTIIVEDGIFYANEIMTKQKFRIYPTTNKIDGPEKNKWLQKYQEYLFLVEKDFCDKNMATPDEIEKYIDEFELEQCPFIRIIMIKEQELKMKERIQEIQRKLK